MTKELIGKVLKEKYDKVGCDVFHIQMFDDRTVHYELVNRKTGARQGVSTPKEIIPTLNVTAMDIKQFFE